MHVRLRLRQRRTWRHAAKSEGRRAWPRETKPSTNRTSPAARSGTMARPAALRVCRLCFRFPWPGPAMATDTDNQRKNPKLFRSSRINKAIQSLCFVPLLHFSLVAHPKFAFAVVLGCGGAGHVPPAPNQLSGRRPLAA
ncbi:hypothetical protein ZWY2020_054078 [Hordeum vulgare]|nr:hypothetical protein ZWY2020_054078 [Hordeum vulgare]